ncbi:aldo/keto reductase [soil metagenome]
MPMISGTTLDVFDLCLGGNVFGWSADAEQSFAVLDRYAEAGGNFIDTADSYLWRAPGNSGGESETILGDWLAARGNRDDMVIATKVGSWPQRPGLSAANITAAVRDSLRRLRTDRIDLYYAHRDDPDTPLEETMTAFDSLVRAGTVRYVAASNYSAARLTEALGVSDRDGITRYAALQSEYNLVERDYERELAPLVAAEGLTSIPFFGLARGFLTGKYRAGDERPDSVRAEKAAAYLTERGLAVLARLDQAAASHDVPVPAVALAWLAAQPTVAAPIASARTVQQLDQLLPMATLSLSAEELALLSG